MQILRILFLKSVMFYLILLSASVLAMNPEGSRQTGVIITVDFSDRLIQINQKQYLLSDKLKIYSPDFDLVSQNMVRPNQQIEFWVTSQNQESQDPKVTLSQVITKIHILTGYDKSFKK